MIFEISYKKFMAEVTKQEQDGVHQALSWFIDGEEVHVYLDRGNTHFHYFTPLAEVRESVKQFLTPETQVIGIVKEEIEGVEEDVESREMV